jgi:hypothetical protein
MATGVRRILNNAADRALATRHAEAWYDEHRGHTRSRDQGRPGEHPPGVHGRRRDRGLDGD